MTNVLGVLHRPGSHHPRAGASRSRAPRDAAAHGHPFASERGDAVPGAPTAVLEDERTVLVAGSGGEQREAALEGLRRVMAPGTTFAHAGALWEVLAAAATSRTVIITGDLGDVSAKSLRHLLSHRYPDVPVVSLEERSDTRGDAAALD